MKTNLLPAFRRFFWDRILEIEFDTEDETYKIQGRTVHLLAISASGVKITTDGPMRFIGKNALGQKLILVTQVNSTKLAFMQTAADIAEPEDHDDSVSYIENLLIDRDHSLAEFIYVDDVKD